MFFQAGAYRTKPVSVTAFQWSGLAEPGDATGAGLAARLQSDLPISHIQVIGENLQVVTDNGTTMASPGDWVVFWKTKKTISVVKEADFARLFDEDHRAQRLRSWVAQPRKPVSRA